MQQQQQQVSVVGKKRRLCLCFFAFVASLGRVSGPRDVLFLVRVLARVCLVWFLFFFLLLHAVFGSLWCGVWFVCV